MPHHIFYSWQSDTDSRIGRGLIQWALDRAIRAVNADADVDPADRDLRADRDTANVPGMPPLTGDHIDAQRDPSGNTSRGDGQADA